LLDFEEDEIGEHVSLHWSRLLGGAFALFSALQTTIFALLMTVVSIWLEQRTDLVAWARTQPRGDLRRALPRP
jgi:hypothetical protein